MVLGKIELLSLFLIIKKVLAGTNFMSKIVIIGAGAMGTAFAFLV